MTNEELLRAITGVLEEKLSTRDSHIDKEAQQDLLDEDEMTMICDQLDVIMANAFEIKHLIRLSNRGPEWMQSKIAVIADKISGIRNYLVGKEL